MIVSTERRAPSLDIDLYADAALRDSRDVFACVRAAGPVVWLPRHRMYAMGRFDDVRAALRNDEVFRSGEGVAANRIVNLMGRDTTLFSDGDTHTARRNVLKRSLGAKALTRHRGPRRRGGAGRRRAPRRRRWIRGGARLRRSPPAGDRR